MSNKGDTISLILNYTINDIAMENVSNIDEIELQLNQQGKDNSLKFLLSDGRIYLDEKYKVALTQEETFKLKDKTLLDKTEISYQLRVYKDGGVASSDVGSFELGSVLSMKVLD